MSLVEQAFLPYEHYGDTGFRVVESTPPNVIYLPAPKTEPEEVLVEQPEKKIRKLRGPKKSKPPLTQDQLNDILGPKNFTTADLVERAKSRAAHAKQVEERSVEFKRGDGTEFTEQQMKDIAVHPWLRTIGEMEENDHYTTGQLAEILKVTDTTIRNWVKWGYIEASRSAPGPKGRRRFIILQKEVDKLLAHWYQISPRYVAQSYVSEQKRAKRSEQIGFQL